MLTTNDLETAKDAALQAQEILWQEQPLVVLYQDKGLSTHRNDRWEDLVITSGTGVYDDWSYFKARLKPP